MKLYLDPGHGGSDPGASANGLLEKALTLSIALKIRDMLLNTCKDIQIRMSRTTDKTLNLKQRTDDANKWGADFFLSLHINAFNRTAHGYEDFIYETLSNSSQTAKYRDIIHREVVKQVDFYNRGKKKANFHVLRESKMPAMLSESGFIDNKNDAANLKSDAYLIKIARGHVNGIVKAFKLKKKETPKPVSDSNDTYIVKKGDTLWGIAKANDTTVAVLKQMNWLKDDLIQPGQKIKLPSKSRPEYYIIEKGDSFWKLEEKFKLEHGTIQKLNLDIKPKYLQIGQRIRIK